MEDLTFGEQVKIILGRKGMTIKQLAEMIEEKTGKKMSRQNLTQRLGRDNFQEQDMRMIAEILECPFQLSIMSVDTQAQPRTTASLERAAAARGLNEEKKQETQEVSAAVPAESVNEEEPEQEIISEETVQTEDAVQEPDERDMTIGELYEIHEELTELEENAKAGEPVEAIKKELEKPKKERFGGLFLRRKHNETVSDTPKEETVSVRETEIKEESKEKPEEPVMKPEKESDFEPVITHKDADEDTAAGELNPYTGREYQSNSVRMHPTRIGYVQVYDRTIHKWTDMTEWAFLGLQERKKALLGNAYEPPIYLD